MTEHNEVIRTNRRKMIWLEYKRKFYNFLSVGIALLAWVVYLAMDDWLMLPVALINTWLMVFNHLNGYQLKNRGDSFFYACFTALLNPYGLWYRYRLYNKLFREIMECDQWKQPFNHDQRLFRMVLAGHNIQEMVLLHKSMRNGDLMPMMYHMAHQREE